MTDFKKPPRPSFTPSGVPRRYASFYLVAVLFTASVGFAGGLWGGKISPLLREMWAEAPVITENKPSGIEAWVAPPAYRGKATIALPTGVDLLLKEKKVSVPEGSFLHILVASNEEGAPVLELGGQNFPLDPDEKGGYVLARRLGTEDLAGEALVLLRQAGDEVARWRFEIEPDAAPRIQFKKIQTLQDKSDTVLAFQAEDDHRVENVLARFTPLYPAPDQSREAVEVPLTITPMEKVSLTLREDFAWLPWTGQMVEVRLVAVDGAGNRTLSDAEKIKLPTRNFQNPLARALAEERKKLLAAKDDAVRAEVVNVMAGIAQQPATYGGDPVVLMALRAGAVRLVFDRSESSIAAAANLIWKSAVRIEEGGRESLQQALLSRTPKTKNPAPKPTK